MEEQRILKYKKVVQKYELVKVKTLAEHQMETGVRRDEKTGVIYPRLFIYKVTARYNGIIVHTNSNPGAVQNALGSTIESLDTFKLLIKVGILHESPEKAAKFLYKISNNVSK